MKQKQNLMSRFSGRYDVSFTVAGLWILLVCLTSPAGAQTVFTLEDAVIEGISNNLGLKIAKNRLTMAQHDVHYGNAGFLPVVDAAASMDKSVYDADVEVSTGAVMKQDAAHGSLRQAGLLARWTLYDGGGMFFQYSRLQEMAELEQTRFLQNVEKTVYQITLAYYRLFLETQLLNAAAERMAISEFRYRVAGEKSLHAQFSELEHMQAFVRYQADSAGFRIQQIRMQNAKLEMDRLLRREPGSDYRLPDSIPPEAGRSAGEYLTAALGNNTGIRYQEGQIRLQQLEVRSLQSGRLPYLVLEGAWSWYENETDASFIRYNRLFGPVFGISAGIRLWDGSRLSRRIKNARISRENEFLRQDDLKQEIRLNVLKLYNEYTASLEVAEMQRKTLAVAQRNMDISREAFQAGLYSSLQFRESQDDLFLIRANLAEAEFKVREASSSLMLLCGMLVR